MRLNLTGCLFYYHAMIERRCDWCMWWPTVPGYKSVFRTRLVSIDKIGYCILAPIPNDQYWSVLYSCFHRIFYHEYVYKHSMLTNNRNKHQHTNCTFISHIFPLLEFLNYYYLSVLCRFFFFVCLSNKGIKLFRR